jgi:uncharacterized membrane protein
MNIFPPFKRKGFFSGDENATIVAAIRSAEQQTSGEIRVFVESHCRFVDPLDRAAEIFWNLKMDMTRHRNSVLVYVAMKDRQFAVFADQGIHDKLDKEFWQQQVAAMGDHFTNDRYTEALVHVVHHVGEALREQFPYEAATDKNELPDDIVFGK